MPDQDDDARSTPVLDVLRWVLFVPAGVVVGLLASFCMTAMIEFNWVSFGPPLDHLATPFMLLLSAAVGGWSVIWGGVLLAPSERKLVPAIIMGALWIPWLLFALITHIGDGWMVLTQCSISIVVAVISVIYFAVNGLDS